MATIAPATAVGVRDTDAEWARLLAEELTSHGLAAEAMSDAVTWAQRHAGGVVVLVADETSELRALQRLRTVHTVKVLVLTAADSTTAYALREGAHGVIARRCAGADLAIAVAAVSVGHTVLPPATAAVLAWAYEGTPHTRRMTITNEEVAWLAALCRGATVAQLARETGYSERSMYRHLSRLYRRLGATGRSDAVARAAAAGFI